MRVCTNSTHSHSLAFTQPFSIVTSASIIQFSANTQVLKHTKTANNTTKILFTFILTPLSIVKNSAAADLFCSRRTN